MNFEKNLEMAHTVRDGGRGHVNCVIMTHYVRTLIDMLLNTFVTIEKLEPYSYD